MAAVGAEVLTGVDEQAQLPFWELRDTGISVRWVQRLPDQTRAFFMGRGFSAEQADQIAARCIFQTVFKNTAGVNPWIIEYDLHNWRVLQQDKVGRLMLREAWQHYWQTATVKPAALIALQWSLLPSQQRYQSGDYNWGMTAYDLPPGSVFDLQVQWRENQATRSFTVKGIECAPDVQRDPSE